MDVHVIDHSGLILAGFRATVDFGKANSEQNRRSLLENLWLQLIAFLVENAGQVPGGVASEAVYEIYSGYVGGDERESYEIFIGYEIESPDDRRSDLVFKRLPAGFYARFRSAEGQEEIKDEISQLQKWMKASGYIPAGDTLIHVYEELAQIGQMGAEQSIEVMFPVQRNPDQQRLA